MCEKINLTQNSRPARLIPDRTESGQKRPNRIGPVQPITCHRARTIVPFLLIPLDRIYKSCGQTSERTHQPVRVPFYLAVRPYSIFFRSSSRIQSPLSIPTQLIRFIAFNPTQQAQFEIKFRSFIFSSVSTKITRIETCPPLYCLGLQTCPTWRFRSSSGISVITQCHHQDSGVGWSKGSR